MVLSVPCFKLASVLKVSGAHFILRGSLAALNEVTIRVQWKPQNAAAAVVVGGMAAVGGVRLNCGCTLPQLRKWCVFVQSGEPVCACVAECRGGL